MALIDPEVLKKVEEGTTIQEVRSADGKLVIGYKGRFCKYPDGTPKVYDNFTECLRENSKQNRIDILKSEGKNEHGQTPDQVKEFLARQKRQLAVKEKADLALSAAASELKR